MKKMVLFNVTPINTDNSDLAKFEENVKIAKELGATHILVTEVLKSRWIWEEDLSDPYPNWGMLNSALFKIVLPDILKGYIPEDYVKKNLEIVKKRSQILKKYGLKAWAYFCDPFYLPEAFYRDYPEWRGARCDHPRRARRAYFSPCVDNKDVLKAYSDAMKKLCEIADIEYVYLHSNDCGSGLCWSHGLYAGANGPEKCRHISMADRVLGFFNAFKEGAKEAGKDMYIEANAKIGVKEIDSEMENVYKFLSDKMAVNFKTNTGKPLSSLIDLNYEFTIAPVKKIMQPIALLDQLEKAYESKTDIIRVVYLDDDLNTTYKLISEYFKKPVTGASDKYKLLDKLAMEYAGKDHKLLLQAWIDINDGLRFLADTFMEGFTWTSINQRLINRPFVLFQNELTSEEKDYYQKYQFQATTLENSYDLLNNQGSGFVKGYYAVWMASRLLDKAIEKWESASSIFNKLSASNKQFELEKDRMRVLICFANNYQNAINFQELVDETNFDETPDLSLRWPNEGDNRLLKYESLVRKEIDNMYELISLIKNRENEMLVLSPSNEDEDIFWLSPDIVNQLNRKIETMQNHFLDGKRLYTSRNQ